MQQINLYQEQFRPRRIWLTAGHVAVASAMLSLALVTIFALDQRAIQLLDRQRIDAENKLQHWQGRVRSVESRIDELLNDESYRERIAQLRNQLKARRETLAYLTQIQASSVHPFSSYLEGLSRQHLDGLWLTSIEINRGGESLRFEGSATATRLVPDFLAALSNETAFNGRTFGSMLINRPEQVDWRVDFVLSTAESG